MVMQSMKDITYYRKIQNALNCETYSEMLRNEKVKDIENDFNESLDVDVFQFLYTNNNENIVLEIHKINYNSSNIVTQKFKSKIDFPVLRGEVLYNLKQNINWLCIDSKKIDYLYWSGILRQCDFELRWQDENGQIVDKWCCITTASQYNSGESEDRTLTIGYNQLLVYLPLDKDTVKLKSDKRFFIDSDKVNPKPYRLTRVDTVSMAYNGEGCVILLCTECQYNSETDSIEKFVCDYIPKINSSIDISYYGSNEISINGKKTFIADNKRNVIRWNVQNYDESDIIIQTDAENLNKCKVLVKENYNLIGQEYILECFDNEGNTGKVLFRIGGEL